MKTSLRKNLSIYLLSSLTVLTIGLGCLGASYNLNSVSERPKAIASEHQTATASKIKSLSQFNIDLQTKGFSFLIESIKTKNAPVNLESYQKEIIAIHQKHERFSLLRRDVIRSANFALNVAKNNNWRNITIYASEIVTATKFLSSVNNIRSFSSVYTDKKNEIHSLIAKSFLSEVSKTQILGYLNEIERGTKELEGLIVAEMRQKEIISEIRFSLEEQMRSLVQATAKVEESSTSNLGLVLIAMALLSSGTLLVGYRYSARSEKLIAGLISDRRGLDKLSQKAGFGWAIFDMNGNPKEVGSQFKNVLSDLAKGNRSNRLPWSSVAELLNLSNSYDLTAIKEGTYNIPVHIQEEGAATQSFLLKLTKCNKFQRVLAILNKAEFELPPMALPKVELPEVNINALVEDAVESLSSFIQANNLLLNIQASTDYVTRCDAEEVRASFTKFIRDVGNYVCTTGGKRKIDIFVYAEADKPTLSFILYNNPISHESVQLNIESTEELWTFDLSLNRLESNLADYGTKVSLQNNFDKNKQFLFANLNFQI